MTVSFTRTPSAIYGVRNPDPDEIIILGNEQNAALVDHGARIAVVETTSLTSVKYYENTLSDLTALTGVADDELAWVVADGTASNNGVYRRASGAWVKQSDLPTITLEQQDDPALVLNDQAAIRHSATNGAPTFPGMAAESYVRDAVILLPEGGTKHRVFRPTDSGKWHFNGSSSGTVFVDLRTLGEGQIFHGAVRYGGTGEMIIDPGADQLGAANTLAPFTAGQKVRIGPGESVTITSRSINADAGSIFSVARFNPNLETVTNGTTSRMKEQDDGLYTGQSFDNIVNGSDVTALPSGFMIDTVSPQLSYPDISMHLNSSSDISAPFVKLPDRVLDLTSITGTFQLGEQVTASGGGVLKVAQTYASGIDKIGIDRQGGVNPAASETLTGSTSGATATVDVATSVSDFLGGETGIALNNATGSTARCRFTWHNLEKI